MRAARRFSFLLAWAATAVLIGHGALAATPPPGAPDVLVLILSEGGPKDRISFTYRGPVPAEQAKRDLATLAKELGQPVPKAKVTTESITKDAGSPRMTSVETTFAGLVDRKNGRLYLEPHARTFRRLSRMRVTYFVFGAFRPGSPMATAPSDGLQLAVNAKPPVYTFDLWRSGGAVASTRQGRPPLGLLLVPVLAAIAAGAAVYFAVRAWGGRAPSSRRHDVRRTEEMEPPRVLAGRPGAAADAAGRAGDESQA